MDQIPDSPLDRSKEIEHRAKLKDVTDRARAARPVDTGADILRGPSRGGTDIA